MARDCARIIARLPDADAEALTAGIDRFKRKGLTDREATREAAKELLRSLNEEARIAKAQRLSPIEAAYLRETNGEYGQRVRLADLPRGHDEELKQLSREGRAALYRLDDPREITERDRKAAIRIGGEDTHIVYLKPPKGQERPKPRAAPEPFKIPEAQKKFKPPQAPKVEANLDPWQIRALDVIERYRATATRIYKMQLNDDPSMRDKKIKGLGMKVAAMRRRVTGDLTEKEKANGIQPYTESTVNELLNEVGAVFSRGKAPKGGAGMTEAAVEAAIKPLTSKWKAAPPIKIMHAPSDAPPDAKGAYIGGNIYVFHDRLESVEDAERVILHEAVGHSGLTRVLGPDIGKTMLDIYDSNEGIRGAADLIMQQYGYDKALAVEETLANLAYDVVKGLNGFKKLAAGVRSWMRSHGFGKLLRRWTDTDVYGLLKAAERSLSDERARENIRREIRGNLPIMEAVRAVAERQKAKLGVPPSPAKSTERALREPVEKVTRRGVQTWKIAERLAERINMDPNALDNFMRRQLGEAYNSENLLAFAELADDEVTKIEDFFADFDKKVRMGQITEADYSDGYEQLLRGVAIKSQFFGVRAEQGRALQIFRKFQSTVGKLEALEIAAGMDEDVALVRAKLKMVAHQIAEAKYSRSRGGAMQAVSRFHKATSFDKLNYVWRNFLVYGTGSHFANIGGAALVDAVEDMARVLAAAIGKFHGGEKVTAGELGAFFHGYIQGIPQGIRAMGESFMTDGQAVPSLEKLSPRLKNFYQQGNPLKQGILGRSSTGRGIANVFGGAFRSLSAEDAFSKAVLYNKEFAALSYRKAHARGKSVNDFIADLRERELIDKEVVESVNKQLMQGPIGKIAKGFRFMANHVKVLWLLYPFLTVGSNIIGYSFRNIAPTGLLMPSFWDEWKRGGATRDIAIARQIIGTGLTVFAFMLYQAGLVTGREPEDEGERNVFRRLGKKPNALKVGDTYIPFPRFDPVGSWFTIGAEISRVIEVATDDEAQNLVMLFLRATSNLLQSKLWLSGLIGASNAITDPARYGDDFINRYATSIIPFSGLTGAIAQDVDPYYRRIDGIIDAMKARTPVLSKTLLPKLDPTTGEPMERSGSALLPTQISTMQDDRVGLELERLGVGITAPSQKTKGYELDAEEHNQLIELTGRMVNREVTNEMSKPRYSRAPDEQKRFWLEDAIKDAKREARKQFVLGTPRIAREVFGTRRREFIPR